MRALMERNWRELYRDPVSGIFCLGFPLVMLAIMSLVNSSIPPEANMHVFEIQQLCPEISVFSLTFTMLLAALNVSRDRSTALLRRLRASPLRSWDYLLGYLTPLLVMALAQSLICMLASQLVAAAGGAPMSFWGLVKMTLSLLPAMLLMVSLGILFGALLPEKAAPGISSIVISVSSILSGAWMDVESLGGAIKRLCNLLPFYHCVQAGRLALSGGEALYTEIGISLVWAAAICLLACGVFGWALKRDM